MLLLFSHITLIRSLDVRLRSFLRGFMALDVNREKVFSAAVKVASSSKKAEEGREGRGKNGSNTQEAHESPGYVRNKLNRPQYLTAKSK